jgi:hypothetical protein
MNSPNAMSDIDATQDGCPAATCSELRGWAQRTIEQWENHDRYRVPENEWPLYELGGHGRQPREVWLARGILASKPNDQEQARRAKD